MICKNCNQELPEYGNFCPYCGAARQEDTAAAPAAELTAQIPENLPEEAAVQPKKRTLKPWQWVLVAVGGLVVLAALVYGALSLAGIDLFGGQQSDEPGQSGEQDAPSGESEGEPANDSDSETSYSAEDAVLVENSRQVVASMGGKELTVGELQMHYQSAFYNFYSQNYYYISYLGLDLEQPLDKQYVPAGEGEEPMTWQQYFVEAALDNWRSYVLLELAAEAEGFQMDPQLQAALDDMDANAQQMATAYGYETVDQWLLGEIGAGVTLADYARYNQAYYLGTDYLNNFYEVNAPAMEEIEAYYAENEDVFVENGVTKDLGLNSTVRHILIQPTGGTTDESGTTTYSEDEWAAAKAEAERILQEWQTGGATEEKFAELANTYSDDGGSNTTGGLYENVNVDANYVANFENWAIDSARVSGDTEIVETEFGYHIMYFVEGEPYWAVIAGDQLIADLVKEMLQKNMDLYPMQIHYEKILVGEIKL